MRILGCGAPISRDETTANPNTIASHIVATARAIKDKMHTIKVKRKLRIIKSEAAETEYFRPFICKGVSIAFKDINRRKYTKVWMTHFFTDIMQTSHVQNKLNAPGSSQYKNNANQLIILRTIDQ